MQPAPEILQPRQLIKKAVKKAGGLRALCRATGIARSTICRNRNNQTFTFQNATIAKLRDFLHGD